MSPDSTPGTDPEKQAAIEKAQAEARKAQAEARQAESAADKAEFEKDQAQTPAAEAAADAKSRKDEAEADKDAAAARQAQIAALIPDFSKVTAGGLEVKGDQPLFGAAMAQRALADAAAELAKAVGNALANAGTVRLLVTSDAELATSDGAYLDVTTSLSGLIDAAKGLLPPPPPPGPGVPPGPPAPPGPAVLAAAPIAGAIAGALPGLLSLFAAQRTVQSAAASVADLSAAAAAIGAIRATKADWTLIHDDFRTMPATGTVATIVKQAATAHRDLTAHSADLKAQGGHDAEVAKLDDLARDIDTYLGAISAVPSGATQSQLSRAILREQLHGDAERRFTHALLVKSEGGALHEAYDNKPLWFKDKFSVVAVVSLTFLLIEAPSGVALIGATIAKAATGHGTIGSSIQLN